MNEQRRLRKRTLLSLLPMAMIVLGASPGRPLQIGRAGGGPTSRGNRATHRSESSPISSRAVKDSSVFTRRNPSKVRHVIHSDSFSTEDRNVGAVRLRRGERIPHGPRREGHFRASSAYTSAGAAAASVPIWQNVRQKTRVARRAVMELAVRSVQFRNYPWNRLANMDGSRRAIGTPIRPMYGTDRISAPNRKRNLFRPLFNLFDRKPKIQMETMDTMDVMGGDMEDVEYMKAMAVLSPVRGGDSTMMADKSKSKRWNFLRIDLLRDKKLSEILSPRGGAIAATSTRASSEAAVLKESGMRLAHTASLPTASSTNTLSRSPTHQSGTWIIETPLFPIILPKSWEPLSAPTSTIIKEQTTTEYMEITVTLDQEEVLAKPSISTLQTVTQPLVPKSSWATLQGNELYYPESMEMLSQTGLLMALGNTDQVVDWVGEKKTLKFLQDHGDSLSLTQALSSTQEVLAWSGKFSTSGQGAELPIIKTMAVIDKSPKYLAELLMDSSKVKVYNKMSLGRSDEVVFQMGVDTVDGSFGDGESKVVRNLTKPPMVNNILEFITCMHARKLRSSDANLIQTKSSTHPIEGYIVVSRAVTGGKWTPSNNSGDKYVRNEILLGVNILKAIPGEPDKTELTAVTHVYSPLIPLMLAKNAGMKGAVDFVRDIRAIS